MENTISDARSVNGVFKSTQENFPFYVYNLLYKKDTYKPVILIVHDSKCKMCGSESLSHHLLKKTAIKISFYEEGTVNHLHKISLQVCSFRYEKIRIDCYQFFFRTCTLDLHLPKLKLSWKVWLTFLWAKRYLFYQFLNQHTEINNWFVRRYFYKQNVHKSCKYLLHRHNNRFEVNIQVI